MPPISPGYVFLAPMIGPGQHGPLVVDSDGEPVWIAPHPRAQSHNLRVQTLAGKPVLTWWEGDLVLPDGYGHGHFVIADTSYREIHRFSPGNGYSGDLHEFTLTSRGTALISIYNEAPANLSLYGGPAKGTVLEGIVQELDVKTGKVLLEWHSLEHAGPDESFRDPPAGRPWDYFHLNSIGVLSGRQPHRLLPARVDRVQDQPPHGQGDLASRRQEERLRDRPRRGVRLPAPRPRLPRQPRLALRQRLVLSGVGDGTGVARAPAPARPRREDGRARPRGSQPARRAERGDGQTPRSSPAEACSSAGEPCHGYSEFDANGRVRYDATLVGLGTSYRAFRQRWKATPLTRPAVASVRNGDGTLDVFTSWNGATEVAQWQILGGADASALDPVRTVPRSGFETQVQLATTPAFVAAVALDAHGNALGRSNPLQT